MYVPCKKGTLEKRSTMTKSEWGPARKTEKAGDSPVHYFERSGEQNVKGPATTVQGSDELKRRNNERANDTKKHSLDISPRLAKLAVRQTQGPLEICGLCGARCHSCIG